MFENLCKGQGFFAKICEGTPFFGGELWDGTLLGVPVLVVGYGAVCVCAHVWGNLYCVVCCGLYSRWYSLFCSW